MPIDESQVELIQIDDERSLLLSKPDFGGITITSIEQVFPEDEKGHKPDNKVIYERDEAEVEEWMDANPQLLKARVKYEGLVYNNATGLIEGYVPFEGDYPEPGAVMDTLTFTREPSSNEIDLKKQGYKQFGDHMEIRREQQTLDPELTVPEFEQEYRRYAREHGRSDHDNGEVIVRPSMLRAVRELEKDRLIARSKKDPGDIYPNAGPSGDDDELPPH